LSQFKLTLDSPIIVARATNLRVAEMRLDFATNRSRAIIVMADNAGVELRRIPIEGKSNALDGFLAWVKSRPEESFEEALLSYLMVVDRAVFQTDIEGTVEEIDPPPVGP